MKSNDAHTLITLAEIFARKKGWKLSTVGLRFADSGSFFKRIKDGKNFTIEKRDSVIKKMSDHWPADLAWPEDIPRPAPNSKERAHA